MKTIISLISDQQIQNLLLIKELNPDRNIFITTTRMESNNQSDKLINTLNLKNVEKVLVSSEDYDGIKNALSQVKFNDNEEVILNLTGGTKIMALAVYDFVRDEISGSVYYLPIGSNEFKKIYPNRGEKTIRIEKNITLEEYLFAYSYSDKSFKPYTYGGVLKDKDLAFKMLDNFLKDKFKVDILNKLRDCRNKGINIDDEIREFLNTIEYKPENDNKLSKYEIRYITGSWFEEYVYFTIKESLKLSDDYIKIGINSSNKGDLVQNEFDIMVCYNNKLYIFECKTLLKENRPLDLFNDTIYKSSALLRDKGLSAESYLVTLDKDLIDENTSKINEDKEKRAKYHRIKILYIDSDDNFKNQIKEIFKK